METRLLKYIWKHSRALQIWLSAIILLSMPFYFLSLELPKRIINGPIQGDGFAGAEATKPFLQIWFPFAHALVGNDVLLFQGFRLDRLAALIVLSAAFLLLVIINGWFKLYINTCKGRIGERVLRTLRYEMIDRILRFPVWHIRQMKAPEIAGIVKDEVDPLSDFIGDSYSAPLFLAGQAITGLAFLFLQNIWFGLLTIVIVSVQVIVIPRLRRQLIALGQQRQTTARQLASRIGEIVHGAGDIHLNDTSNFVRADISRTLGTIFDVRLELFRRKFAVKFLNNLLMQFISVLFYLIGGYFVITGRLDVGSLVASIAAYKDLPAPIKGLIDWDQQRLLAQVRFAQALEAFRIAALPPAAIQDEERQDRIREGFAINRVSYRQKGMPPALEDVSLTIGVGERVALVSTPTESGVRLLEIMTRLIVPTSGSILLDGEDIAGLPESMTGRTIGYSDGDTFLPAGTIRDSLLEVLRNRPQADDPGQRGFEVGQADRAPKNGEAGGALHGAVDPERTVSGRIRSTVEQAGLYDDICRIGLNSRLAADAVEVAGARVVATRRLLREHLDASGLRSSVEPFDPLRYLTHASIAENVVFGMTGSPGFDADSLPRNPIFMEVLDEAGLAAPLLALGEKMSRSFVEMFRSVSSTSVLFDAVATMTPGRITALGAILERIGAGGMDSLEEADRHELLALALDYDEPGYRFALLDDAMRAKIVKARHQFQERFRLAGMPVSFYDPQAYDASLSVIDNVLFGRIATRNVGERARLVESVGDVLRKADLWDTVFEAGLAFHIGIGGRGLSDEQRQKLRLARALMKKPDILILNRACAALPAREQEAILLTLLEDPPDPTGKRRGIVCMPADPGHASFFDRVIILEGGSVVADGRPADVLDRSAEASPVAGAV